VIEAGKRTQQGRLARSAAAKQRHELAGRDVEIDSFKHVFRRIAAD
jgi:hypothetical protein